MTLNIELKKHRDKQSVSLQKQVTAFYVLFMPFVLLSEQGALHFLLSLGPTMTQLARPLASPGQHCPSLATLQKGHGPTAPTRKYQGSHIMGTVRSRAHS